MSRPKNILFITSDEMRGDVQGYIGNPDVKTPHLDALAARGCFFEKHFVPFPKCVPSRCSMHTGRYTHTDGLRSVMADNHLRVGDPTMGEFLRDQGYETAVLGLNHVWETPWFYGAGDRTNEKSAGVVDYQSFTKGPIGDLAKKSRVYPAGTQITGSHIDALAEIDYNGLTQGEHSNFCDENRADQAMLYLREVRDRSKPFFLQLNLGKPHPPYAIHEPWYSMYDRKGIQAFPYALPENAALPLRAMREHRLGFDVPEDSLREIQAVYYGMVSFIDDLVGQVIRCLDEQGLADDTLIIFTADHGDFAGQYGLNEKWDASLQDCLLKVPFIMAGPGIPAGKHVEGLSEHVDIPATVLDYLGMKPPQHWVWHGSSLLPVIAGTERREYVYADGGHEKAMRDRFCSPTRSMKNGKMVKDTGGKQLTYGEVPDAMSRCKMIRSEQWKLIIREVGGNEFFDMVKDPHEMRNLYGDPAHQPRIADMTLKLVEWCLRTDTDRPYLAKFGA
jgi:arylsulfatase A-like enzyme